MSGVKRFEELIAWQKARELTQAVYAVTREGALAADSGLAAQMQRAAVSIMSNIAEGFERSSSADFHRFLVIAKASCGELRSQLYVALDAGYISEPDFAALAEKAEEVSRVIDSLRASVSRQTESHLLTKT